jgi:hypothetical protein
MKIVTTNHVSKHRIIDNIIAEHTVNVTMGKTFYTPTIHKKLIVRTNIVTREVMFIVTYAHFDHEFDNIVEALIKYNDYV